MFEGKPPRPGESSPLESERGASQSLRPLSWGDLVARLAAARDLRAEVAPARPGARASFDAGSARKIAHHNGKQGVNLEDSGNGKGAARTANGVRDAEAAVIAGAVRE